MTNDSSASLSLQDSQKQKFGQVETERHSHFSVTTDFTAQKEEPKATGLVRIFLKRPFEDCTGEKILLHQIDLTNFDQECKKAVELMDMNRSYSSVRTYRLSTETYQGRPAISPDFKPMQMSNEYSSIPAGINNSVNFQIQDRGNLPSLDARNFYGSYQSDQYQTSPSYAVDHNAAGYKSYAGQGASVATGQFAGAGTRQGDSYTGQTNQMGTYVINDQPRQVMNQG